MTMQAYDLIREVIFRAEQIERHKQGRALTDDEVKTLQAAAFLRKIAPWAFSSDTSPGGA